MKKKVRLESATRCWEVVEKAGKGSDDKESPAMDRKLQNITRMQNHRKKIKAFQKRRIEMMEVQERSGERKESGKRSKDF